ncbi:MAG TPA: GNAT family N-acetyltransferase, partial [Candidatus Paceibacterota bacterium]
LMIARDGERLVGMATIYLIKKIGNRKAYIEDMIVDEEHRSQGIGGKLMHALIDAAREQGARSVELMTRIERKDAHRFYERLGFKNKDRYVYKLEL